MIHASELLGRSIKQNGVDTLFFLMGGPMLAAEAAWRSAFAASMCAMNRRQR